MNEAPVSEPLVSAPLVSAPLCERRILLTRAKPDDAIARALRLAGAHVDALALTVSTPFVAPVVTVPSIAASRVLPAVRPLGVHPRAGGIVVLSRPITATRATVLPCKTATCPEAVTLIVAATPACLAVVRAVLTVLIRHGPSFTLALPPVALVLSFT